MDFIERLTDEQIRTYLDKEYPKKRGYKYSFRKNDLSIILYVYVKDKKTGEYLFTVCLSEYEAVYGYTQRWVRYLYEVFGEEYKQAFLERYTRLFK